MGMLVLIKDCIQVFQDKNINGMELITGKILEENLVSVCFLPNTGR
jgi:phosphoribosylaminoimidazole (AIR) synthetase